MLVFGKEIHAGLGADNERCLRIKRKKILLHGKTFGFRNGQSLLVNYNGFTLRKIKRNCFFQPGSRYIDQDCTVELSVIAFMGKIIADKSIVTLITKLSGNSSVGGIVIVIID